MAQAAQVSVAAPEAPPSFRDQQQAQQGDALASHSDRLITAPADKVSPRQFLDALGLSSPELRAARQAEDEARCIRAIERGDTYGFPPMLVRECRAIMAETILDLPVTTRADGRSECGA